MVGVSIFMGAGGVKQTGRPAVAAYLASGQSKLSGPQIAERCVMLMLSEAARCFDETIIRSARDGDIGAVFSVVFRHSSAARSGIWTPSGPG